MNIRSQKSPVVVHSIGEAAVSVLSNTDHGSILASMTGAVYLQNDKGELCWLIPMDAPMHQRGIMVSDRLPQWRAGSRYEAADQTLVINPGVTVNFHQSPVWRTASIPIEDAKPVSGLPDLLRIFADQLLAQNSPAGLGYLIKPIMHLTTQKGSSPFLDAPGRITEKAWLSIQGIILASFAGDPGSVYLHAKSLAGLGEGLTPSGDDFLGGFFFSMQSLKRYYPRTVDPPICTYLNFLHEFVPLTNLISYTILTDLADGHAVEPMHQLTEGLLLGVPADVLCIHARKLISMGHSTGWDLLTGFFAGMFTTIAQLV